MSGEAELTSAFGSASPAASDSLLGPRTLPSSYESHDLEDSTDNSSHSMGQSQRPPRRKYRSSSESNIGASDRAGPRGLNSPAGETENVVRVYRADDMSYKTLRMPKETTAVQARDMMAMNEGLGKELASFYSLLVLYPSSTGEPSARLLDRDEIVADSLRYYRKLVASYFADGSATPRRARRHGNVKLLFCDSRTPLELAGTEFESLRNRLSNEGGINSQHAFIFCNSPGPVSMAGHLLMKLSNLETVWVRKWVIIKNTSLFICHDVADVRRPEKVDLSGDVGISEEASQEMRRQRVRFFFTVNTGHKVFTFRAPNEAVASSWILQLRTTSVLAESNDVMASIDTLVNDQVATLSSRRSDLIKSSYNSIEYLLLHPHTLFVLAQFMRMKRLEEALFFVLDSAAFTQGCAEVWRRQGLSLPEPEVEIDQQHAKVAVLVGSAKPGRWVIGGVRVRKGTEEDVDIARQRYNQLCRRHMWEVAHALWRRYHTEAVRDTFINVLKVSEDVLHDVASTLEEVSEHRHQQGIPTELPSPYLFAALRRQLVAALERLVLPEFVRAPFHWSLMHSLALQPMPERYPHHAPHAPHWQRWIPKFDMMGYLHAVRIRERKRRASALSQAAEAEAAMATPPRPPPQIESKDDDAAAAAGGEAVAAEGGSSGNSQAAVVGDDSSGVGETAPEVALGDDATGEVEGDARSDGEGEAGGDAEGEGESEARGEGEGEGQAEAATKAAARDRAGTGGSGDHQLPHHRASAPEAGTHHIRGPAEFLAARAAQYQRVTARRIEPAASAGDGAFRRFAYTVERLTPQETLPHPVPMPSLPLRDKLETAAPRFLNPRLFGGVPVVK